MTDLGGSPPPGSRRTLAITATLVTGVCLSIAASVAAQSEMYPLTDIRTIDGRMNNPDHPTWGSAGEALRRGLPADYEDGVSDPPATGLPGAREVSNLVAAQTGSVPSGAGFSDYVWQWGQFLDHDIDLIPAAEPHEAFPIPVPAGDPWFDPEATGTQEIPLFRSAYEDAPGARQQINAITAFVDASNVYGSDGNRALELRTLDGTGRLRTSPGELLPFNTNGFPNAPDPGDPSFFLAGDVRANEQVALTALHTLFVREHNYQAESIGQSVVLSGDQIYELARAIVGAEMQVITYGEFLPSLLGEDVLAPWPGYNTEVAPGIENAFSTAAYRFGHSMLTPVLLRLDEAYLPIPDGSLALRDAFFAPHEILENGGIEPLLRGLAKNHAQEIDPFVVDDVRNFLFGPPGAGGFDLASLNLQRGRDHGLPRYNQARRDLGLAARSDISEVSSSPEIQSRLAAAYDSVEDIDFWIGGLAEDHHGSARVGELFFVILKDQFERLRNCDRFWYENHLPAFLIEYVESQTLADIIRRNTTIGEIQNNVFLIDEATSVASSAPPERFRLGLPFPNPARRVTSISLDVPSTHAVPFDVGVFDVRGRRVSSLLRSALSEGRHILTWDRRLPSGASAPAGVYFIRSTSGGLVASRKVVVLDPR